MTFHLTLTPHDPVIARDGRPFGAGQGHRMRSLNWPYPSVLAGALRTLLGKLMGGDFPPSILAALKQLEIAGPFPLLNHELYFPAPTDLAVWEDEQKQDSQPKRQIMPLRPMRGGTNEKYCDLPEGLLPVVVNQDIKAAPTATFWSKDQMCRWLMDPSGYGFGVPPPPEKAIPGSGFLNSPQKDERVHVKIDPDTGAAEESMLFVTVGLDLSIKQASMGVELAARADGAEEFTEQLNALDTLHPFGGERRLMSWRTVHTPPWDCPNELRAAISGSGQIRLVLATPALFQDGWKPGWLDEQLEGSPPGTNVRLRLVSACLERWKPLSGWSLERDQVGPKAVRRLVPAGSVYFFLVVSGDVSTLVEKLWLRSVSDQDQDRRDGFGLALWGVWAYPELTDGEK